MSLLLLVILVILVIALIIIFSNSRQGGSKSGFRAMPRRRRRSLSTGRTHPEDSFLPVVMSNLGANPSQFGAATNLIKQFDQICGKVGAASEIQKVLNMYGPTANWGGLITQLNQDLAAVKQNRGACPQTGCSEASQCAYGGLNPNLGDYPPYVKPGYDCVGGQCQLYRAG